MEARLRPLSTQSQVDRGGPRTLKVDAGFFRIHAIKSGPQGGTRYEHLPPSPANMA